MFDALDMGQWLEPMLKVASLFVNDKGSSIGEFAINCAELADQVLYSASDVVVNDILELDVVEGIEMEEGGLEARAEDAVEVGKHILWEVDPNFLQSNGLKGESCQDAVSESV